MKSLPVNIRQQAGFTLFEVLIVLVIIGTIMGLAASVVFRKSDTSKIDAAKIQVESFKNALTLYELDLGHYPSSDLGLNALIEKPQETELVEFWKGPYIKSDKIPLDPWNKPYVYQLNESGQEDTPYFLYSQGSKPEHKVGILPPEMKK